MPATALVLGHAFIDGLCATGSASAPYLQEALAEPVAHSLKNGSGANSAEHPLGHLAIGR